MNGMHRIPEQYRAGLAFVCHKRPRNSGYPWRNIIGLDRNLKGMLLFYGGVASDFLSITGFWTTRHHTKHCKGKICGHGACALKAQIEQYEEKVKAY